MIDCLLPLVCLSDDWGHEIHSHTTRRLEELVWQIRATAKAIVDKEQLETKFLEEGSKLIKRDIFFYRTTYYN
jgi:superfamily II RNA helicase